MTLLINDNGFNSDIKIVHGDGKIFLVEQEYALSKNKRIDRICRAIFFSLVHIFTLGFLKGVSALKTLYWKEVKANKAKWSARIDVSFFAKEHIVYVKSDKTHLFENKVKYTRIHQPPILSGYLKNRTLIANELRKNPISFFEIIKDNGLNLEYAEDNLKKDTDFVNKATNQNPLAIQFADNTIADQFPEQKAIFKSHAENRPLRALPQPLIRHIYSFLSARGRADLMVISPHFKLTVQDGIFAEKEKNLQFINRIRKIVGEESKEGIFLNLLSVGKLFKNGKFFTPLLQKTTLKSLISGIEQSFVFFEWERKMLPIIEKRHLKSKANLLTNKVTKEKALGIMIGQLLHERFLTDVELHKNKEIVKLLVYNDAKMLELVSNEYKADEEIVLEAISADDNAFKYADPKLMENRDFICRALEMGSELGILFASEIIREDRDIYFKMPHLSEISFRSAPDIIKDDLGVALKAIKDAEKDAKSEHSIFLAASPNLRNNKEFIIACLNRGRVGEILRSLSEGFKDDEDVAMKAIKRGFSSSDTLSHFSMRIKDNFNIVLVAVSEDFRNLEYASARLQKNPQILKAEKSSFLKIRESIRAK
ncbi:MAG: DUF4116 domain-containing protein [Parachlamydiaceae bacterium]|nr:DUF4116 domain-containing protein [Parachlamydiaceae bacterium]